MMLDLCLTTELWGLTLRLSANDMFGMFATMQLRALQSEHVGWPRANAGQKFDILMQMCVVGQNKL
jgi:hypothetical protein